MFSHYLMFGGDCAEALGVYVEAFGAEIVEMQTYGQIRDPGFPEEMNDLILHSRLRWEGSELMCADSSEHRHPGDNMYVAVASPDEDFVRRAWEVLMRGGTIYMDLESTVFSGAHGSLRDRFGVNWMFTVTL